jgi:hypothetical protein
MKAVIRPLESTGDQEDLAKLRTFVRPHSPEARDASWQLSIWSWLERHPLASEMHRWVLDTGEEIVGHLAALPQYYRIGGQRVVAHAPADYMVLPAFGFYAITLMRRFFRTCENCVVCDSAPAVIGIERKLGAREAGQLQAGAKLWNVSKLPGFPKWIPAPVAHISNWGLLAVDRALTDTAFGGPRIDVLDGFDASFDELFESVAAALPCVPEKDASFLQWRYGPASPQYPVTVIGVKDGETLLGYAVLRVTSEGDNGYILDLTTRPGRDDVARALLREAVRYFSRAGVYIIRYRFLESPVSPRTKDLWRLGFFPRNERRHTLLVKFAGNGLHKMALDAANWSYNAGDGEMSFWVR